MGSYAPLWAVPAYLFVGLAVLWYLVAIRLAALYQHVLYPRWHKRRYDCLDGMLGRCRGNVALESDLGASHPGASFC